MSHGLERSARTDYTPINKLYAEEGIVRRKNAPILYFPHDQPDDRFENRFFTSNKFGYKDNDGKIGKFGFLLSMEGEKLLKSHPGFLNIADYVGINGIDGSQVQKFTPRLGAIEVLQSSTSWSVVIAKVDDVKCVIKWRDPNSRLSQPGHHEMLQVQSLKRDLANDLHKIGVILPEYLFATPLISCRYFEEGKLIWLPGSIRKQAEATDTLVRDYIDKQNSQGNMLWKCVAPDAMHIDGLPSNNFVCQENGMLMWFDPVLYVPPDLLQKQ